jgi:hypothetical protein
MLTNFPHQNPPDFGARNQQLLSAIMSLIGGKSVEFDRFKQLSTKFRGGQLSPSQYHSECLELIDRPVFEKFLPQLIALLPDIGKQKVFFKYFLWPMPLFLLSTHKQCILSHYKHNSTAVFP